MKVIPGKRAGSKIIFHIGFKYSRDSSSTHRFRCSRRKSGCTAQLNFLVAIDDIEECLDLDEDDDCTVEDVHNHLEEICVGDWCDLLEIIKKRCRETNDGPRNLR